MDSRAMIENMQYEYFIASRYRNKGAVLDLAKKIRDKGKSVYCFVESDASIKHVGQIADDAEQSIQKLERISDWNESRAIREVFDSDMNALKVSQNVIMLLPAGNSAHTEAGVAYGLGKNVIMVGQPEKTESLYFIFNQHYKTADEFLHSI